MYSQNTTVYNVAVSNLSGCVVDRAIVDIAWRVLQHGVSKLCLQNQERLLCGRVTQHSQMLLRTARSCSFDFG